MDEDELEDGEGSLARFTTLRSLYLRKANGNSMVGDYPRLSLSLRCVMNRSSARAGNSPGVHP